MRLPTGKGTVSGTIQWESEKQPLYSTPTGLTGTLVTSTNYSIQARVKLTNLSTGSAYYSSYFSTNSSGKYQYSVSNLPDGEYSFKIDSPYGYIDVSSLPETITIDGRALIVSGAVNKSEASSGSVSGTVTYDVNGNYDAIYGATVSFKRLGDSSNSASVSTSATGTFASGNIKRGFYQITIKLPSTLGGATFYYRMFVGDTHNIMQQYWLKEGLTVMWPDEIDDLSNEICADAESDKEKVQAIYHWITTNIRYDYEAEMVYQNVDISRTVQTKKGICFDYATLFAALCRSQGIPCFILDGYSRDNSSYKHTWNRVYYDNRYWNLDVTYDAIQIQGNSDVLYGFRSIGFFPKVNDDEYVITRIY